MSGAQNKLKKVGLKVSSVQGRERILLPGFINNGIIMPEEAVKAKLFY